MIARIQGKIVERGEHSLLIENGGFAYEVSLPAASMQRLDSALLPDGTVRLVTYHYHHVDKSRSIPVLIGFLNAVERDFFLAFITVSGIGPRGALRALNQPISLIAKAIDEGDLKFLTSLPGIGQQKAKLIVAELQNKVGKFGLMKDAQSTPAPRSGATDAEEEALAVLAQLGYKKQEALAMVTKAVEKNSAAATAEELLNEVYKLKKTELQGDHTDG